MKKLKYCIYLVLFLLISPLLSGCIAYMSERVPNLVEKQNLPAFKTAVPISVILRHKHTLDGNEIGGATEMTYKKLKESYARVRPQIPFLAQAEADTPDPKLILELTTEVAEHGKTSAIVTGATLFIIPGFTSSDIIVKADLKDLDGNIISSHSASGQMKMITQLLFIVMLPIDPFIMPGDELYDDTFKDVFIQMAPDLEAYLAKNKS